MTTILMLWTVVGFAGTQMATWKEFDWRPLGEFRTLADCQRAAAELALDPKKFRCINNGRAS
jgi:hypothetical protein